jgi:HK97 family phage portal protein
MGNIFTRMFGNKQGEERSLGFADFVSFNSYSSYGGKSAMLLSAVYRAVEAISDAVAQLPFEPYRIDKDGFAHKMMNEPIAKILNKMPNKRMTRYSLLKQIVSSIYLQGNAFVFIERYKSGNVKSLKWIPSESVQVNYDEQNDVKTYQTTKLGFPKRIKEEDMIHIMNFSYDGIVGVSTLTHARNSLALASDSEAHASGFFKGGANLAGILKILDRTTKEQKQKIKEAWQLAFSPQSGNPNGVAVLDGNMEFQPITVNPADAQLLETRQFNVVDICRWFGISPVKLFDLSKSSYSTVEATQLAFLTDTLSPLLEKIEQEFEMKLFPDENIDIKFDVSRVLKADRSAVASYYSQMINMGAMTINEIRKDLNLPPVDNGDETMLQSNLYSLEAIINNNRNESESGTNSGAAGAAGTNSGTSAD